MISEKFVILGALINLYGTSFYVRDTIAGKTKPNRVSWFMWAFASMVAFSAELHQHVGLQALMTFVVGFSPLLVFLASFVNKKSVWKITKFDVICGALSLLGIILWLITRHGNFAIVLTIIGDIFAGIPTFKKVYTHPLSETSILFLFAAINSGLTILTIKHWNFATYGFPIYIFIATVYMFLTVTIRRKKITSTAS